MKVDISMNDLAVVTLTERGMSILAEELYMVDQVEPGNVLKVPLWQLFMIFGKYTYMGPVPPFMHITIIDDTYMG